MKRFPRQVISKIYGIRSFPRQSIRNFRLPQLSSYSPRDGRNDNREGRFGPFALACIATAALSTGFLIETRDAQAEAPASPRTIRLAEVRKHGANAQQRWVVKGTKVYDITDWIPNHPGGEVILRAVGGVIDTYWDIFTIHKKQDVSDILEQYYIGDLDPQDLVNGEVPQDHVEDPFKNDPERDKALIQLSGTS